MMNEDTGNPRDTPLAPVRQDRYRIDPPCPDNGAPPSSLSRCPASPVLWIGDKRHVGYAPRASCDGSQQGNPAAVLSVNAGGLMAELVSAPPPTERSMAGEYRCHFPPLSTTAVPVPAKIGGDCT